MKIFVFIVALSLFLAPSQQAKAFFGSFFNPCDDCSFFLKYCCPGKCPILDIEHSIWESIRGKQHRNRLTVLGGWRETQLAQLRAIGHSGPRTVASLTCEPARSVIGFPTHGQEYGFPRPDRWIRSIPDPEAAKKVVCSTQDRTRKSRQLRASSISDAAASIPNLAIALEHASQRAGSAVRGAQQAQDLRDLSLRLSDLQNARLQINSVTNTTRALRLQLASSFATSRTIETGISESCQ